MAADGSVPDQRHLGLGMNPRTYMSEGSFVIYFVSLPSKITWLDLFRNARQMDQNTRIYFHVLVKANNT